MSSLYPGVLNGMTGDGKALDMLRRAPIFGYTNTTIPTIYPSNLAWRTIPRIDTLNSDPMRITTITSNTGGARGVMPCKGVVGSKRILRRPAVKETSGMYPVPIPGVRGVPKGLLEQPQYKARGPLMPKPDSFNAAMNSRLGQPA
jgi:hypothetical protein